MTLLGVLVDELKVQLADETLRYGGAWYDTGHAYHDNMLRWFHARMRDAGPFTLLDVGASTGAYALMAAHLPGMTAWAFEPYDEAFAVLQKNLRLNGLLDRVHAVPLAVSDAVGEQTFHVCEPREVAGLSQLGGVPRADKTYHDVKVAATTIDQFVAANFIQRVDVLKIDTEGGELAVLTGAMDVLRRDHPLVICEYAPTNACQYGYDPEALVELLTDIGYNVRRDHEDIIAE